MDKILSFLKENQGRPIFKEDIYKYLGRRNKAKTDETLNYLISQGLIYPYNDAFYLTSYGEQYIHNPNIVSPYYEIPNRDIKESEIYNEEYWNNWVNRFILFFEQIKKNHPELESLFNALKISTIESLGKFHDSKEFVKEVSLIFNKFDFSLPEFRLPNEPNYSVPQTLASVEHAIAEAIQRVTTYSNKYKSFNVNLRTYRKVYDIIDNLLQEDDDTLYSIFKHLQQIKVGTFVYIRDIETDLDDYLGITHHIKNPRLVNASVKALINKIYERIKHIFQPFILQYVDIETSANELYKLIFNKTAYKKFLETAESKIKEELLSNLFNGKDYTGIDLSNEYFKNISVKGCNFTNANLTNTIWEKANVIGNIFVNANFTDANFHGITNFRNNNISGANFLNATLSTDIDKDVNKGEPINFTSPKITKKEMIEHGFKEDESFDNIGINFNKHVPGRGMDIKGDSWLILIQATPLAPIPKELYDAFNLHNIPAERLLGWIGGKYNTKSKVLYVTKLRSDLLQRTFELNNFFLDKIIEKESRGMYHGKYITSYEDLRKFVPYRHIIEQYFKGWQHVFMNWAVKEAKKRNAKYIAVPATYSYNDNFSKLVNTEENGKVVQNYPYTMEDNWYIIPVDEITKVAKLESFSKLSFNALEEREKWKKFIWDYIYGFIEYNKDYNAKEVAKDAYKFMIKEIPDDVKKDVEFIQLLEELRYDLISNGIGDIFDDTPSFLEDIFNANEKEDNYEENINDLLDQLNEAKQKNDVEQIEKIKLKLNNIIKSSNLNFSFLDNNLNTLLKLIR